MEWNVFSVCNLLNNINNKRYTYLTILISKRYFTPGVVAQAYNLSSWEIEAEDQKFKTHHLICDNSIFMI